MKQTATARTTADAGKEQARRAGDSPLVDRMGRVGFAAQGTTYLLLGTIAGELAFGRHPHVQVDQRGAFEELARQPFGKVLLGLLLVGLVGYVGYLVVTALAGEPDEPLQPTRRRIARAGAAWRAGSYAILAYSALTVLIAKPSKAGSGNGAGLLGHPYGRVLVGLIGLALGIGGIVLAVVGMTGRFDRHLKMRRMHRPMRKVVRTLGRYGALGRGAAFTLTGVFFLVAAVRFDPAKAHGLDSSLRGIARHTEGRIALALIALGLLTFGVFAWCEARWRRTGREGPIHLPR